MRGDLAWLPTQAPMRVRQGRRTAPAGWAAARALAVHVARAGQAGPPAVALVLHSSRAATIVAAPGAVLLRAAVPVHFQFPSRAARRTDASSAETAPPFVTRTWTVLSPAAT